MQFVPGQCPVPHLSQAPTKVPASSEDMLPTASDGYIAQFYSRSRLHHLSTWANQLRDLVRRLRLGGQDAGLRSGRDLLAAQLATSHSGGDATLTLRPVTAGASRAPRVLMHMDMDCFFVSVCLRGKPHLLGKRLVFVGALVVAVILGHDL